ncbi:GntR family transcriptional regulator [Paenibacillus antri]|uniref:GntR family transcriptional regulator n=1 Tax=Paenibacillus antri TaxID=2582848 RepID=A0A5R9G3I6_9BACL|nr:GntR family transcriptional regulator [Paenibacillus antri]TLS50927.1 GntR family transcriptional regulator [Paenibacillus antri]
MKVKTLKEKAYDEIRRLILRGELKAGEFLTENSLVERLKMSRTPIRAAIERLDADGHLTYIPNRGIFVSEMTIDKVIDFYDFRMAIESHVVKKLAARPLQADEIAWFRDNLRRQNECIAAKDNHAFTVEDSAFHRQLTAIYGNKEILLTMERLQDKLYRIALNVLQKDSDRVQVSYEDHVSIFENILEGKVEDAADRMTQHLEFGKRILVY